MIRQLAAAAALVAALAAAPREEAWQPDLIHSRAEFTVSHLIVSKVWGHIPIRALTVIMPAGGTIPVKIDATLDPVHLDTDNKDRDADLRSAGYFDVATYPTITFRSTKIAPRGTSDFDVTGDLTIKNVTHSVTFPAHVEGRIPESGGTRVGYSGALKIDRRQFGLNAAQMNPAGVPLVGNDVQIGLTLEATSPAR